MFFNGESDDVPPPHCVFEDFASTPKLSCVLHSLEDCDSTNISYEELERRFFTRIVVQDKMMMIFLSMFLLLFLCTESVHLRFDRDGKPDKKSDFSGCIACNFMYSYVDGDKNFYPSASMTTLELKTVFSQERRKLVNSGEFEGLASVCNKIPGLSERDKTGNCANIVRHFFQDPIKVALCVGNTQDDPGMDTYCGCAVGGGRLDKKTKKRCPASLDLLEGTTPTGTLKPAPRHAPPTDFSHESSTNDAHGKTETETDISGSREERKCEHCMRLMIGDKLREKVFILSNFASTQERVKFSQKRKKFLDQMVVYDYCQDTGDSDCVSVFNFIQSSHKTALCLSRLPSRSEDDGAFCGCVAEGGSPRSEPLVCPSANSP